MSPALAGNIYVIDTTLVSPWPHWQLVSWKNALKIIYV